MNDWILYTLLAALFTCTHGFLFLLGSSLASRNLERGYLKALLKRDRKIINRAMQMVSEDENSSVKRNFKLVSENRRLRIRMFELTKQAKEAEQRVLAGRVGAVEQLVSVYRWSRKHD